MQFPDHLISDWGPTFYSPHSTKSHIASYLRQYRQHQRLAASRALFPSSNPPVFYTDDDDQLDDSLGRQDEDDELVLARLRKAQMSLPSLFAQLEKDLARLEATLVSKRRSIRVQTSLLAAFAGWVIYITINIVREKHSTSLNFMPHSLQVLISWAPAPFAGLFIASHERQISVVEASIARLRSLQHAVASSHPVKADDVRWMDQERWSGVNWRVIGM